MVMVLIRPNLFVVIGVRFATANYKDAEPSMADKLGKLM